MIEMLEINEKLDSPVTEVNVEKALEQLVRHQSDTELRRAAQNAGC